MSTSDGVTRAALYWNLAPQDVRHDLLIRCLKHTTLAGCIDALAAAYGEKEAGESREQELDHSGWPEHIRRTIR